MPATRSQSPTDTGSLPLLRQHAFRRFVFARFFSRVAQNAVNFGLLLLVVQETGRAFFSSLLVLALVVPTTVAGILSGALSDFFPKRVLMFAGHAVRGVICLLFARVDTGAGGYFAVAALLSLTTPLATAAEAATVPVIVERHLLARANALNQATMGVAQLVGFGLLTPLLLRVFGSADLLFLACGVCFLAAALNSAFIGRLPSAGRAEVGGEPDGPWWVVGWRALRAEPKTWRAALELTLISTSLIILGGLVPKYLQEVLGLRVDVGVLALVPGAVGVAMGLRLAGFLAHRVPHTVLSSVGFVVYVASLGVLSAVGPLSDFLAGYEPLSWLDDVDVAGFDGAGVLASATVLPLGFSFALVSVAAQTALNDLIPLRLQGRAQATQSALAALVAAIPVLIAGAAADLVGVAPVIAAVAVGTAVAATGRLGTLVAKGS